MFTVAAHVCKIRPVAEHLKSVIFSAEGVVPSYSKSSSCSSPSPFPPHLLLFFLLLLSSSFSFPPPPLLLLS